MAYWIIKKEGMNCRSEYLMRIRPTKFTDEKVNAQHMTGEQVARHSQWLIMAGISHTLEQNSEV